MDIKVATAGGLAIIIGLGVQSGLHCRKQARVFSSPRVVMAQVSSAAPEFANFDADWDQADVAAAQVADQRECIRKSLKSAHSEMRQSLREELSSARQERELAFADAREMRDQVHIQVRDNIRDQVREQRDRLRDQQQVLRDQLRQQRDELREQQRRWRDDFKASSTLD